MEKCMPNNNKGGMHPVDDARVDAFRISTLGENALATTVTINQRSVVGGGTWTLNAITANDMMSHNERFLFQTLFAKGRSLGGKTPSRRWAKHHFRHLWASRGRPFVHLQAK